MMMMMMMMMMIILDSMSWSSVYLWPIEAHCLCRDNRCAFTITVPPEKPHEGLFTTACVIAGALGNDLVASLSRAQTG
jgi:hypothetical protein